MTYRMKASQFIAATRDIPKAVENELLALADTADLYAKITQEYLNTAENTRLELDRVRRQGIVI